MKDLTSTININVNSKLKKDATIILNDLGLNMSTAINIFLNQIVKTNGIPFEIKNHKPSKELEKALKEAELIETNKIKTKSYNNIDDLKKDLLN